MSDIKFACPHCEQHIACDNLYCGEKIQCPGCKGSLYVPPLAAAIPLQAGGTSLAVPIASKERRYPSTVRNDAWTEQAWERHSSELGVHPETSLWAFVVLPLFVALVLLSFHVRASWILLGFILVTLAAGLFVAKRQGASTAATVLRGILYSLAIGVASVVLGVGVLFAGCMACH